MTGFIRAFYLIVLVLFATIVYAQSNSPYSRYQLGDVYNNTHVALQGMGNVSTAMSSDKNTINTQNPASYTSLQMTLFNIGATTIINDVSDQKGNANKYTNINISGLQLAFPAIPRMLGLVLGFEPRTTVKYNIVDKNYFDNQGVRDSTNLRYIGDGGTYFAYAGIGVGYKYFSIGANLGYYWGEKISTIQHQFYAPNIFSSNKTITSSIGGFYAEVGGLVHIPLHKNHFLHIGATAKIPQKIPTKVDSLHNTYYVNSDFGDISIDTILNRTIKTHTILPLSYSAGITYDNSYGVTISADFTMTNWSTLSISDPGLFQGLTPNSKNWTFRMGGEFIPFSYGTTYFNFMAYRLGFNVGNSNLSYNNKSIPQFEISTGLGLPIRRFAYNNSSSTINVSFSVGKNGNQNTPLQSTYYRIGISFSLGDIWFIKRKYD